MKENILGRESEKELLSRIYESKRSEFVAVCGRRRVGKTFLVREFFEEEMFFQCAGEANAGTQEQLKSFFHTLRRYDSLYANGYFFDMFFLFETLLSHRLDREGAIGLTCEKT